MNKTRSFLAILAVAAASLLPRPASAQTPTPAPVQIVTGADGTPTVQTPVVLTPGQTFTVNAAGLPVAVTIPTVPAQRADTSTATTAALTRTVTFSSAMPSANYSIGLVGTSGIGALQMTYSNKTATGFTINFSLSTSAAVDYTATAKQ